MLPPHRSTSTSSKLLNYQLQFFFLLAFVYSIIFICSSESERQSVAARPALGDNRVLNDLGAFRRFARSLELRAFRTHAHTRTTSENCSRNLVDLLYSSPRRKLAAASSGRGSLKPVALVVLAAVLVGRGTTLLCRLS